MTDVSVGDTIVYKPRNGGSFPTGEEERSAVVEAIRSEIIIRQINDEFTNRIEKDQVVCVCSDDA